MEITPKKIHNKKWKNNELKVSYQPAGVKAQVIELVKVENLLNKRQWKFCHDCLSAQVLLLNSQVS